jgi:hypothetical protein
MATGATSVNSWDDAFAYAGSVIEQRCAEQGITVGIQDPEMIARSVYLLRIGKRDRDAVRIEVGAGPPGREHRSLSDVKV